MATALYRFPAINETTDTAEAAHTATVIAPAVANAIFNAVGSRVRHMPITAEAVLKGMSKKA